MNMKISIFLLCMFFIKKIKRLKDCRLNDKNRVYNTKYKSIVEQLEIEIYDTKNDPNITDPTPLVTIRHV